MLYLPYYMPQLDQLVEVPGCKVISVKVAYTLCVYVWWLGAEEVFGGC